MKAKTKDTKNEKVVLSPEAKRIAKALEDKGKEFNEQGQKMIEAARLLRGEIQESK